MKRYEIECFKVTESYDRDSWTVAYASSESLAKQIADLQKHYRHVSKHKQTITVFETMEEFVNQKNEDIKKAALAKLTDVEKQALGL